MTKESIPQTIIELGTESERIVGATSDAVEFLRRELYDKNPRRVASQEHARLQTEVARIIYDLRKGAKLTQAGLAKRIRCRKAVIGQLEAGDYEGDLLTKLSLIVKACGKKLQLAVVDE